MNRIAKNGRYVIDVKWYDTDGKVFLEKSSEGFGKTQDIFIPKIIRYIEPQVKRKLTMVYSRRDINKPIPADKFRISIPKSARKINLMERENI